MSGGDRTWASPADLREAALQLAEDRPLTQVSAWLGEPLGQVRAWVLGERGGGVDDDD